MQVKPEALTGICMLAPQLVHISHYVSLFPRVRLFSIGYSQGAQPIHLDALELFINILEA